MRALARSAVSAAAKAVRFARSAVESPREGRAQLEVLSDLVRFRLTHRGLRRSATPVDEGRVALLIDFGDFVVHAKTESLFAKALETRGLTAVVASASAPRWTPRYWRAFGIDRRVTLHDYRQPGSRRVGEQLADEALREPTFSGLSAVRYREIDVGRQALASLIRGRHQGNLDFDDAQTIAQLRTLLVQAVEAADAAERLLDDVNPELALVNDALYVGVGAVFEAALNRSIPVIQWVAAHRDDALVLKRISAETRRMHPVSLADETWERVRHEPWTEERDVELRRELFERYVEGRWESYYNRAYGSMVEADELRRKLGLDPGKKTATIFSHILWDSTLFWGEDLFEHYEEWLVETVRAAVANPRLNWLVKFHPGNVWKLRRDGVPEEAGDQAVLERRLGLLPPHVKLIPADSDVSTFAVFGVTDYCLTVRGTVGIEAAPLAIAVLTAGTGRYSGLGFTVDSASAQEYLKRLARLEDVPPPSPEQVELAKKYAHALFVRRPTRFDSFRFVYKDLDEVGHPLDHNLEIGPRSPADVRHARDLQAFSAWAVESRELDFMASD